jgi:hypothetical protein
MARKIITGVYVTLTLYILFVAIQMFTLQINNHYNLVNVTMYFSLFIVLMILLIVFYEYIVNDRFTRLVFMFIIILNLNYFILSFFFNMITVATGTWAGPTHLINLIFNQKYLSEAVLIEYNQYFKAPLIFNIVALVLIVGIFFYGRKK